MSEDFIAKSQITINIPIAKLWDAFINPATIKKYMFNTEVTSDWKEGSPIFWRGIWKDKPYEDKGIILKFVPEQTLQYSHYSPLTGAPDVPESYHTVTIELSPEAGGTQVTLTQDNNSTDEERQHSQQMWDSMLDGLKKLLESA